MTSPATLLGAHSDDHGLERRKVLVVGIDGLRYDILLQAEAPTLHGLMKSGLHSRTWIFAQPMAETCSGPGWAVVATGVWPDKHGIVGNHFEPGNFTRYPDFVTRAKSGRPGLRTVCASTWAPLGLPLDGGPLFRDPVDVRVAFDNTATEDGYPVCDRQVASSVVEELRIGDPDLVFLHFDNVDETAHRNGSTSQAYRDAIATVDEYVGGVVDEVHRRAAAQDEDWLILVTTDHGHTDTDGHGGSSWKERQAFVVMTRPGTPPQGAAPEMRNVDIAPTVLHHLGIAIEEEWGLDGYPIGQAPGSAFDVVRPELKPCEDIDGPETTGWSRLAPPGWQVVSGSHLPGADERWSGWTMTTTDVWPRLLPDRGRENFVRGRGVFAVADPGLWAAASDGSRLGRGRFDATLRSAPLPLDGEDVVLAFETHYRQSGDQTGTVAVSIDGGAECVVLGYGPGDTDANSGTDLCSTSTRIPISVPPGSRALTVTWRLRATAGDGASDGYWAVAQPRLERRREEAAR